MDPNIMAQLGGQMAPMQDMSQFYKPVQQQQYTMGGGFKIGQSQLDTLRQLAQLGSMGLLDEGSGQQAILSTLLAPQQQQYEPNIRALRGAMHQANPYGDAGGDYIIEPMDSPSFGQKVLGTTQLPALYNYETEFLQNYMDMGGPSAGWQGIKAAPGNAARAIGQAPGQILRGIGNIF